MQHSNVVLVPAQHTQRQQHLTPLQQRAIEKTIPQSLEAEQGILGSIIIDPDAISNVSDFLTPDDFYWDAHRTLYETILGLYRDKSVPADYVTICDALESSQSLERVTGTIQHNTLSGASYISALINGVPTSGNAEYYGRIVKRDATLRREAQGARQIIEHAYAANADPQKVLLLAMTLFQDIANDVVTRNLVHVASPLEDYMSRLTAVATAQETQGETAPALLASAGLKTGYGKLDRTIFQAGFKKTNFVVIAARPGMGKSTALLNIALHTARTAYLDPRTGETRKRTVVIFSLEMSLEEIINSLLAQLSGINSKRLDPDILDIYPDEWDSLLNAENILSDVNLYIDCTSDLSCQDAETRILKLQQELGTPVDLVCFDYLQLMKTNAKKSSGNRTYDVNEISNGLKQCAVKLNTVVLCATQLNRENEKRANKEPQMSDMKDSGNIEQDANIILAIHREDEYDPDSERKGIADMIVLKYRKGERGRVEMFADYPQSRFIDIASEGSAE